MADPTRLLSPRDTEWNGWLRRAPHDVYHLASYHAFAEAMGEGRACMLVHGSACRFIAWPYLVRSIGQRLSDASSVYGYTGPTGVGLDDADFRERAWLALRAVWAEQGLVTLFTRFHPLLENARICEGLRGEAAAAGGEVLYLGRSVSMDLAHDRDTRRRQYPQVLRQEIKRSERAGLTVELDRDWASYPTFMALYRDTMQKNDASGRYLFSDRYFQGLRRSFGDVGHLAVARIGDEAAAIMVFTVCGDIAEAHLTGVSPRFRALSPLKGLIDGVADLARGLGATRLHLGAGRGGHEDSLFAFKSRFSPLRHDFSLGRWILDRPRYEALVRECGGADVERTFFPAYRAPIVAAAS